MNCNPSSHLTTTERIQALDLGHQNALFKIARRESKKSEFADSKGPLRFPSHADRCQARPEGFEKVRRIEQNLRIVGIAVK